MSSKQEQFIQDLVQFYRNRGIANVHQRQFIVRLNGKIVDLHELYSYALEYGGSYRVNQVNLWEEIYAKLFRTKCVGANFAVALRQIYNRYLLQYEKTCSTNVNNEQWNEEEEDESSLFSVHNHNQCHMSLYHQHQPPQQLNNVTDASGKVHNDTKLYCSLLSGLPNELNFAFNIATILSNCNRFDWSNDYKFINVLIESLKSYCCVCDQVDEDLSFGRTALTDEDEILNFENFINYSIHRQFNDIIAHNGNMESNGTDNSEIIIDNNCDEEEITCPKKEKIEFIEQKCSCYMQFWYQMCTDEKVLDLVFSDFNDDIDFNLPYVFKDFPFNLFKRIEQRIELVIGIIRNTSFTYDENNCNNVTMVPLLKFLILLLRSENANYVNQSLDILSNIAPTLSFSSSTPFASIYFSLLDFLLRHIVEIAMNSNNIHNATKSFEIMARYISKTNSEANQKLESHFDSSKLYERITQLLTCQYDITLLLALLEFCLAISEARPFVLVNNDNKTFIKILVNLLNCDSSKYFTTGALKKVKIIDDRPRDTPQAEVRTVPAVTQPPQNVTVINNTRVTPNLLDNESFAYKWLKMTYDEAAHNSSISINDIYGEYVKHCCRNLRRNVIAAQSFSVLLRTCFPSCNINVAQSTVEGLVMKNLQQTEEQTRQTPSQNTNQLMSPILKAHLSTPPKNNPTNEPNQTPQITTATTNTSTLIKSLLANKLRNNQQIITTQPILNSSATPVIVQQNDANKQPPEGSPQKGIIFNNNPQASFPSTLNIQNNLIVPNTIAQPPVPGSQQIYLVRTIITGPGQQNSNQPVRLLVPASMITQPRLPAPGMVSTANGAVVGNSVIQTVAGQPSQLMQTQITLPTGSIAAVNHSNSISLPVTSNAQSARTNSVANSSPLLNVLLDKGKLPDFPTQANQQCVVTSANMLNNNPQVAASSQSSVQPQTKMLILTTNTSTKPNIVCNSTATTLSDATTPNSVNLPVAKNIKTNQVVLTTPVVNGDINKVITANTDQADKDDSANIVNKLDGKRPLEVAKTEVNKRLKPSLSSESNCTISNGCEVSNTENNTSKCIGETEKFNCELIQNNVTKDEQSKIIKSDTNLNSTAIAPVQNSTAPAKPTAELDFECQWNGCHIKFARASEVFFHVHSQHIMVPSCPNVMNCLWGGPEGRGPGCLSKRPKLSLLTHLQDFHCNANILKQESLRKKQLATLGTTNIMLPQPPAHPGYAQNAAMVAIYRHNNVKTIQEPPEPTTPLTPLNVSIRLTAALILRNLAKRSHTVKKSLELFEPQLCEISIAEGRDESRTIAQCLAMLNEGS